MSYKVVVIGGGPGGYVAAVRAAQLGARVALVEKGNVGGTCLNRGCIPTKVLAAGASMIHTVRRAADFGVFAGEVTVDFSRLAERKDQVVGRLVQGVEYLIKKNKIDLIKGTARLAGKGRVAVEGPEGARELEAENIILATGTEPALIEAFGYDGERVFTSDQALNLKEVPERLAIIGGGVIGCEFACIFSALGAKVTVLEMMPAILPLMDKDVSRQMQSYLKRQGISVLTKVKIESVRKQDDAVAAVLEGGQEVAADRILISIGRVMNLKGLGLEKAGVSLGERGEVLVNDRMETSAPGIYAVGDITGCMQLAHVASAQGLVAAENIMGRDRLMDYRVVPSCIFTHPEAAGVGMTAQEAESSGIEFKSGKFSFIASGKAQAMGETEGFVKVLADAGTDRILGVHIVGPHATDLIAGAAVAMQMGATVRQLAETIHAHPTLAEAVVEAAEAVHGMSIHT
ncbi:MAG: dihydrolipoyl dehydrogenase [Peptococcaceae bacterium]|nr:dihydrolipoyl dehydrogenase [Peptococcaceae bacterium]